MTILDHFYNATIDSIADIIDFIEQILILLFSLAYANTKNSKTKIKIYRIFNISMKWLILLKYNVI